MTSYEWARLSFVAKLNQALEEAEKQGIVADEALIALSIGWAAKIARKHGFKFESVCNAVQVIYSQRD